LEKEGAEMKLPKQVRVRKKTYKIKRTPSNYTAIGESDPNKYEIRLDKDMVGKLLNSTFKHELLHAISDEYNLNWDHRIIKRFEKLFTEEWE
jgi:hypothetical protein